MRKRTLSIIAFALLLTGCKSGQNENLNYENDNINDNNGDGIGSYPQTKVTDSTLTSALSSKAGSLPTSDNSQLWTSYKYYISGSNDTDFMWYQDISYNSEKYRGVYFTSYRPDYCNDTSSTSNSSQDDNGYDINTVYWFK